MMRGAYDSVVKAITFLEIKFGCERKNRNFAKDELYFTYNILLEETER